MDLLKYAVVVVLPDTETYGFLIIISFFFIASAWFLYVIFLSRERIKICGNFKEEDCVTKNATNVELNIKDDIDVNDSAQV